MPRPWGRVLLEQLISSKHGWSVFVVVSAGFFNARLHTHSLFQLRVSVWSLFVCEWAEFASWRFFGGVFFLFLFFFLPICGDSFDVGTIEDVIPMFIPRLHQ